MLKKDFFAENGRCRSYVCGCVCMCVCIPVEKLNENEMCSEAKTVLYKFTYLMETLTQRVSPILVARKQLSSS